jgi:hypothetical protein
VSKLLRTTVLIAVFVCLGLSAGTAYAYDPFSKVDCSLNPEGCKVVKTDELNKDKDTSAVKNGINTAIVILGSISVLMIVIGGIKYTVSGGDSAGVQSAKNTILYAIIGIIVAVMAFAIVNAVIKFI